MERDRWIMVRASYPEKELGGSAQKREQLADPGFRDFYLTYDHAYDWHPNDPRLDALAGVMAERLRQEAEAAGVDMSQMTIQETVSKDEQALLSAHVREYSPAWIRLTELLRQRVTA